MEHAIICDLDGTLALFNGRGPYDYQKCDTDLVNRPVALTIEALLCADIIQRVIFTSGREDSCREKTEQWIREKALPRLFHHEMILLMRKSGDYRKDWEVKEEIYHKHIEGKFDVLLVLDDRQQVVDLWRRLGLTCFQVAPGPPEKQK